jgi:hypothetical protein
MDDGTGSELETGKIKEGRRADISNRRDSEYSGNIPAGTYQPVSINEDGMHTLRYDNIHGERTGNDSDDMHTNNGGNIGVYLLVLHGPNPVCHGTTRYGNQGGGETDNGLEGRYLQISSNLLKRQENRFDHPGRRPSGETSTPEGIRNGRMVGSSGNANHNIPVIERSAGTSRIWRGLLRSERRREQQRRGKRRGEGKWQGKRNVDQIENQGTGNISSAGTNSEQESRTDILRPYNPNARTRSETNRIPEEIEDKNANGHRRETVTEDIAEMGKRIFQPH